MRSSREGPLERRGSGWRSVCAESGASGVAGSLSARRGPLLLAVLAICCLALAAVELARTTRAGKPARASTTRAVAAPMATGDGASHFVLIMLENRELHEVIGSGSAPYIEELARGQALAESYHAITHPSLPNYIALLAGSTLGISSDCTSCEAHGTNLVDQLEAAHIGWRAYMQGMPSPCYRGAETSRYAKRHDPFMYFRQISADPGRCDRIVPLSRLAGELRNGTLPPFVWITPDLCADGHNCGNSAPNHFLAGLVPTLLAHLGRNGVLAIVWDEGSTNDGCCSHAAGGTVPLILAGRPVRHHYVLRTPADHYSLLATIEQSFGLSRLRGAACPCTPSLSPMFRAGHPPHL